jgi:hypothetical protein
VERAVLPETMTATGPSRYLVQRIVPVAFEVKADMARTSRIGR